MPDVFDAISIVRNLDVDVDVAVLLLQLELGSPMNPLSLPAHL